MKVSAFADIEKDFLARVRQIVWCNVATVDRRGRPRSRILHPIWEGRTGWILTGRHTLKTRHLAANPHVSRPSATTRSRSGPAARRIPASASCGSRRGGSRSRRWPIW